MASVELESLMWGHKTIKSSSTGHVYEGWEYNRAEKATGGVGISNEIYNASEKVIKYLTFTYVAYNQVGDQVKCTVKGEYEAKGRLTGPIDPNEKATVKWDVLWYNPTISEVAIKEIHVEFMDGSEETIDGNDIIKTSSHESVYYKKRGKAEHEEALKRAEERKKADEEQKQNEILSKKRASVIKWSILAVIVVIIAISVIVHFINQSQYDIDNLELNVTDKINDQAYNNGVYIIFEFNVENKGKVEAESYSGILTVSDKEGNVLMEGEVNIYNIKAKEETKAQIKFTMSRDSQTEQLWNTAFEDLVFSFEPESARFEGGAVKTAS